LAVAVTVLRPVNLYAAMPLRLVAANPSAANPFALRADASAACSPSCVLVALAVLQLVDASQLAVVSQLAVAKLLLQPAANQLVLPLAGANQLAVASHAVVLACCNGCSV
jgi:hypothetical protein